LIQNINFDDPIIDERFRGYQQRFGAEKNYFPLEMMKVYPWIADGGR
jgi:hypothetical protein